MMIRTWQFPVMIILAAFSTLTALAADESGTFESHFDTGISPDGETEVTVLSKAGEYQEELHLRITDVKSGRLLGDHPFDGFSFALHDKPQNSLARDDVKCSWRSDGRCVALTYPMTRGFVGTTFYAPWRKQWVPMALPEFDKQFRKFCKAAGKKRVVIDEHSGGKGHESWEKWLPHHRFRLDVGYRGVWDPNSEGEKLFWVTFRVVDAAGEAKPKIVLEKIEFAPDPVLDAH